MVKIVSNVLTQTSETVYNFEVENAHSYFADELGLWVHNPSLKGSLLGSTSPSALAKGLAKPRSRIIGLPSPARPSGSFVGVASPCPAAFDPRGNIFPNPDRKLLAGGLIGAAIIAAAVKAGQKGQGEDDPNALK